jgi:penicillin amidase
MRTRWILTWLLVGMSVPFSAAGQETAESLLSKSKAVLSQIEGEIRLPGLKAPVEVLRDRWGVPHIYAQNQDDLFFAQGFVAAQDRLFQIDMWRRLTVGETAEVLGKEAIEADRFARLLKYRGDMQAEWTSYSPDTQQIAVAFTRGINACIEHSADKLPIEFQLLGFKPKPWQPEDILGRMSGIVMSGNFRDEVQRAQIVAAVGAEKARRLFPTDPQREYGPVPGLDLVGIDAKVLAGYEAATRPFDLRPSTPGSNNWVIDGTLSASGKPMLANDPHRSVKLPSLRYLVHLHAPGWNVIGSGEPGLPGVALGHNERIAWGFTIVHTDQTDIYVEETKPDDDAQYRVGNSWQPMRKEWEKLQVKGQTAPVELELRYTRHGPVVHQDSKRNRAYVLRWTGNEPGSAAYLASLALDRAKNWKEFRQGAAAWKTPSENLVYADVDGNIGWIATALTPIRDGWDGLLPVPGAAGAYEWKGFLSIDDLPQTYNPSQHYVATANHNILPKDFPREISYEWSPRYRFERIRQRLEGQSKFTLEDFQSIQHDNTSLPGQALAKLARNLKTDDAALQRHIDVLTAWDGVLTRETLAGPLYAVWLQELMTQFFKPHVPEATLPLVAVNSNIPLVLASLERPDDTWFGTEPQTARDRLLREALQRGITLLEKILGSDVNTWTWGRLHTITLRHPLSNQGKEYSRAFDLQKVSRPGDALTPNAATYNKDFEQTNGASYREVFDLADWDRGLATSTPGQSGQPGSPHYGDLLSLWGEGQYFPLYFSRAKIDAHTAHRLELKPR